ncbi:hypothetical protein JX265_008704 [Neoarthrinium moseri]|uniref:DUF427 domain-containing protein n=1 Tax=Neoarthrinium moseri TaxID=1658444 RepID=A0A9P9WH41_9PEZI|nr:uncharacterized protein JN550_008819 [Neoarthrinium moseri]KAI1839685.1 hypothetical protein JX266_014103 [Neoarthrinium moseri]KAI1863487.1 hypothetical protein JX265_008704 [Neoarthrinium moseri]KAI1864532.1 hypothetical protein JN550_008819 [Neoarthrinium moseri]
MASPFTKSDLLELGRKLIADGPVKTLRTPKRIRILFNGTYVADTTSALYVWEHPFYPYYYVPLSSFVRGVLHDNRDEGPLSIMGLHVGGRSTDRVLAFSDQGGGHVPEELRGMVRVEFAAADAWFEEDERIYVHPKDPFRRVDIVHSARPVRVLVDGVQVARSSSSLHLYETGLPVRYYLPPTSVDRSVLRDSQTTTQCPYKGVAEYYDIVLGKDGARGEEKAHKDLVWYYRNPTHESAQVAGALCFYNEKVDIELDGHMLERPKTHFA